MSKKKPARADEDLMQGAWDWIHHLELEYGIKMRLSMLPITRRGIYTVRAEVYDLAEGKPIDRICLHSQEWPCAQYQTLAGAFLGLAIRIEHLLPERVLARASGNGPPA